MNMNKPKFNNSFCGEYNFNSNEIKKSSNPFCFFYCYGISHDYITLHQKQFSLNNLITNEYLIRIYDVWMQETTQRIIKLLGLLLPDLLAKKCSYQTSL